MTDQDPDLLEVIDDLNERLRVAQQNFDVVNEAGHLMSNQLAACHDLIGDLIRFVPVGVLDELTGSAGSARRLLFHQLNLLPDLYRVD